MTTELTFNKPLDVIYMDTEKEIRLGVNTYTKICLGDNTAAQLVGRKYIYQSRTFNPSQFGLVSNNGVEFYVNKRRCGRKTRPRFALTLEEPINIVCMDEKLVVKDELTNLLEEQEKIRSRVKELQEKQSTAGFESIIKGASNVQNLTDCKDGDIIEVCGAVQRNTRYGLSYIIVDGKGTAYWADAQTKSYLSILKPTATHNGCDVICNRFNLKILGHRWTSSRNRCVRAEISAAENIKELEEPVPKPPLPKKNNLGKPTDYNKLDGLAVGTVLDVKNMEY